MGTTARFMKVRRHDSKDYRLQETEKRNKAWQKLITYKVKELPDKPSALLRLAITDALAFQADGGKFDMNQWLFIGSNNSCVACLAGAVMVRTLDVKSVGGDSTNVDLDSFQDNKLANKLQAVDNLRTGDLDDAAMLMGIDVPDLQLVESFFDIIQASYDFKSGLASWDAYNQAIKLLEENGF